MARTGRFQNIHDRVRVRFVRRRRRRRRREDGGVPAKSVAQLLVEGKGVEALVAHAHGLVAAGRRHRRRILMRRQWGGVVRVGSAHQEPAVPAVVTADKQAKLQRADMARVAVAAQEEEG